jgi:formimidoylglutamate deiminase
MLELNCEHEQLVGRQPDAVLDSWIFAGDKHMLESVWVAGRRIIRKGRHREHESLKSGFVQAMTELQRS